MNPPFQSPIGPPPAPVSGKRPRTYDEHLSPLLITLDTLLTLRHTSHCTHHPKFTESMQVVAAHLLHMLVHNTTPTYAEVEALLEEARR